MPEKKQYMPMERMQKLLSKYFFQCFGKYSIVDPCMLPCKNISAEFLLFLIKYTQNRFNISQVRK